MQENGFLLFLMMVEGKDLIFLDYWGGRGRRPCAPRGRSVGAGSAAQRTQGAASSARRGARGDAGSRDRPCRCLHARRCRRDRSVPRCALASSSIVILRGFHEEPTVRGQPLKSPAQLHDRHAESSLVSQTITTLTDKLHHNHFCQGTRTHTD